jgi:hypothetical protein
LIGDFKFQHSARLALPTCLLWLLSMTGLVEDGLTTLVNMVVDVSGLYLDSITTLGIIEVKLSSCS